MELTSTPATGKCSECGRIFDMANDVDIEEWHYGHDCEAS